MATPSELLVYGYLREELAKINVSMPIEINNIFVMFYSLQATLLRFGQQNRNREFLKLTDDDTKVTKVGGDSAHRCFQSDLGLIYEGVHCYRVSVYNPVHTGAKYLVTLIEKTI